MPDLGVKLHFGRRVRVVTGDLDIDGELASFVNCLRRPFQSAFPVVQILVYSHDCKVKSVLSSQLLKLFLDSEFRSWNHYLPK